MLNVNTSWKCLTCAPFHIVLQVCIRLFCARETGCTYPSRLQVPSLTRVMICWIASRKCLASRTPLTCKQFWDFEWMSHNYGTIRGQIHRQSNMFDLRSICVVEWMSHNYRPVMQLVATGLLWATELIWTGPSQSSLWLPQIQEMYGPVRSMVDPSGVQKTGPDRTFKHYFFLHNGHALCGIVQFYAPGIHFVPLNDSSL